MALFKDNVVIIKSINIGEADKIITVFGQQYGKFSVVAKGIRKIESRNRGNLQTMNVVKISFYRRSGLGVLTESELIVSPDTDKNAIKSIERVLMLVSKVMQEEQPDKEIYTELVKVVRAGFNPVIVNKFRLYFLKKTGYVEYASCAACGKSAVEMTKFSAETFEFYCTDCAAKSGLRLMDVKIARENPVQLATMLDSFISKILE